MEKLNIWEFKGNINIKINLEFLKKINQKIKEDYKNKKKLYEELIKTNRINIPFPTFKDMLKPSYRYFISLNVIKNCCLTLNIPLEKLQRSVLAYKTKGGYNIIINPKLPIEITPLFDMLIAHHIGDGSVVNPQRGRQAYFSYRQYNQKYMKLYLIKIESIFGKIKYKKIYREKTKTYCPALISNILFDLYNLNTKSFLSKKARIPEQIFKKDKEFLLAFLLGTIIDDGHIDSTMVVVGLRNKNLVKDLLKICKLLDYKASSTERTLKYKGKYKKYWYLNILKEGMINLWKDYNRLIKKYPEANLGYKGKSIAENLKIKNRKIKRKPGNEGLILNLLSKRKFTVNELSKKIYMTRQGTRYHIHKLEKAEKIKKVGINRKNNYIYSIIQR